MAINLTISHRRCLHFDDTVFGFVNLFPIDINQLTTIKGFKYSLLHSKPDRRKLPYASAV